MACIETKTLKNGIELQLIGIGTYKVSVNTDMTAVIRNAMDCGLRSIDTAEHYGNETEVGEAIRSCGYKREEIFLSTKIWNTDHGYEKAMEAYEKSRERLGTYIDMLLIHWPCPMRGLYLETWQALCELYRTGKVKAIGVSNFKIQHLEKLMELGLEKPMVNQVEMHPYFIDYELLEYCEKNGILVEAWSPLLRKGEAAGNLLIDSMAAKFEKTPIQIVLRYLTQLGVRVLVKSSSKEHMSQNADIFEFTITQRDIEELKKLNTGKRVFQDPDEYYL
jgi:diketogulonate reductase-like aldo/keto reductase